MKCTMLVLLAAAAMISTVPAYAHHSFAATYFEDKTDTVEGDLVQFLFRNPHSFVHVEGKDAQGDGPVCDRVGRGPAAESAGRDARDAEPWGSRDHHGEPGPQS